MDPFQHFLDAQAPVLETVLAELQAGKKVTHWIWFIFPQFAGLGYSEMSQRFAIWSRSEAEAYLAHPILGPRLITCVEALLIHEGKTATSIFGELDAAKLRSSMTLFAEVSDSPSCFEEVLARFFDGKPDEHTIKLLVGHP